MSRRHEGWWKAVVGLRAPPLGTLAALGVFGPDSRRKPNQLRKLRSIAGHVDGRRTHTDETFNRSLYGYDVL